MLMETRLRARDGVKPAASIARRASAWGAAAVFALALVVALPANQSTAKAPPESFADLAERLLPSVVNDRPAASVRV